ncbi:16S rRNA (cytosine(967)-C(5))-methyltransferase RsmB [Nitrosomonas sp. ANs5]|uniref:16S rRNA (cytosine(967)-C(5))-methyltransferase RsmB n=1 Tax=Nitrosomonas sp. ANs5 TaxID=3423941 RepID=UPI003D346017
MIKTQLLTVNAIGSVLAGANLTGVLRETWRKNAMLSSQQRGAIQDLAYGVLRYYSQLDTLLKSLLHKPLPDRRLHYLLLVSLYQLNYSKAPVHAIVNHAVSSARMLAGNRGASGLVNAILRNFIRQQDKLLAQTTQDETARYAYPQWWIDKLRQQYPQHYAAILLAGNQHPPMTLRVNQKQITVSDYQARLQACTIDSEWLWGSALKLSRPVAVEQLPGFAEGLVSVQDAGAQLAAPLLDVDAGMRVLDACAAPGGKSTHLMELADIKLTVMDKHEERLALLQENFTRLNMPDYQLICGSALEPSQWWDGRLFDRILADVPCSASGVVNRHPDIKWLRRPGDIEAFAQTQRIMLRKLWPLLCRGGKLLYATCSVFSEENSLLVTEFLSDHEDASALPCTHETIINHGQLLPSTRHDGFFYALLQKN